MSAVKREPIKVAVIEDTPALGKLVQRIVDSMDGIQTFGVWENAEDGLKAIENGSPDVVLMDISLPGMSGIEATARVKEKHPEIDVIMLTVFDDNDKIFDALQAGASGYLLKNASPDDLCRAIFEPHQQREQPGLQSFQAGNRDRAAGRQGNGQQGNCSRSLNQRGNRPRPSEAHLRETARSLPYGGGHEIPGFARAPPVEQIKQARHLLVG